MVNNRTILLSILLVVLIIAFVVYDDKFSPSSISSELTATNVSVKYSYDSTMTIVPASKGSFYMCTKDGIKFYDKNGKILWEDVFNLTSPTVVGGGNFIAVSEVNGNSLYVFGEQKKLYFKFFDKPIVSYSINQTGYASVILKNSDSYERISFDLSGNIIFNYVHGEKNYIPIISGVSSDAKMASSAIFDLNNLKMASHLNLAYIKKEDQKSYADAIFSSFPFENSLLMSINFLIKNNVLAVTDSSFSFLETQNNDPKYKPTSVNFNNKISFINYFGENGFMLAFGRSFVGKPGFSEGHLEFYDSLAKKISEYDFKKKITSIYTNNTNALVTIQGNIYAFNKNGRLLWQNTISGDFSQALLLDDENTVLIVYNDEAVVMKRGK